MGKVSLDSIIHSYKWRSYDILVDVSYDKHLRVNHSKYFVLHGVHIGGYESLWPFVKHRLAKFNGIKNNFYLHLKKSEC